MSRPTKELMESIVSLLEKIPQVRELSINEHDLLLIARDWLRKEKVVEAAQEVANTYGPEAWETLADSAKLALTVIALREALREHDEASDSADAALAKHATEAANDELRARLDAAERVMLFAREAAKLLRRGMAPAGRLSSEEVVRDDLNRELAAYDQLREGK